MAMNKTLVSTIVCFTIVLLMAVFQFALDDVAPIPIPESLQGLPITLVAASLVAMSFLGFAGVV